MKRFRKLIAIILTLAILASICSVFAGAVQQPRQNSDKKDAAPIVLVHGFGGWGQYDAYNSKSSYWGGGAATNDGGGDLVAFYNENGYEAYAASVGPVSSAWDRACELYAQLTGTVVDYGEAHSQKHHHERFGKSFEGQPLMGEEWKLDEPINLVGHSFGGPASRLFVSLLAFGDEDEIAATGEETSALFIGGHAKSVHSVTTLSGAHNGSQVANMIYDFPGAMKLITLLINLIGASGSRGAMGDINLGHFGLTPKQGEEKAKFCIANICNFVKSEDNAGYDLTLRGSKELNEKIRMSPDTYYYSYSGYVTQKDSLGFQKNTAGCAPIFKGTCVAVSMTQGTKIDGVKMTQQWAINDGMVPLISAMYPLDEADNAVSYKEAKDDGSLVPGVWYYHEPMYGVDHGDYCWNGATFPQGGFEEFYLEVAKNASGN